MAFASDLDQNKTDNYKRTWTMDTGKSLLCFIAGAMAGAVATLFLAPDSGENTRARIRRGAADMTGKARNMMAEGLEMIEKALEEK